VESLDYEKQFKGFNPLTDKVGFYGHHEIVRRALALLPNRTATDLEGMAKEVEIGVGVYFEKLREEAVRKVEHALHATSYYDENGWTRFQFEYLDYSIDEVFDVSGKASEGYSLTVRGEFIERLDVLLIEDTPNLEAIQSAIETFAYKSDDVAASVVKPYEYLSVFALWRIIESNLLVEACGAVSVGELKKVLDDNYAKRYGGSVLFRWKPSHQDASQLAVELACEAQEAICIAEYMNREEVSEMLEAQRNMHIAKQADTPIVSIRAITEIPSIDALVLAKIASNLSEAAVKRNDIKWAQKREQKKIVDTYWQDNKTRLLRTHKQNPVKTASREIISESLTEGVAEATIEKWLRMAKSAAEITTPLQPRG
jgi:hypothetical protein